jgi:hypothetical protein
MQVTYSDLSDEKTKTREVQGLIAAMHHLTPKEGLLLTDNVEGDELIENLHIRLRPVWKFLCGLE